ncbi:O-antigen ligase family protein [Agromyces ramosus]|uniref:Inorganic carbon (HCO3(-)) transporter n=1 Tax=Agromyces ramosus TaxID=33879 RepID=A0ABU0R8A0_9MICO|nr:O-antigen ligase family protein [Agromyces ramosus]MDQ0894280.1 putative inorganic carbon (HCO3(-)) transporter [Agromyces ramosus]
MDSETTIREPRAADGGLDLSPVSRGRTPLLLRFTLFAIFFFPATMVIEPLGASGTVPTLLCLVLLLAWLASWLWGLHDPIPVRHPGRLAISLLLLASIASYAALYAGWTGGSTEMTRASADRWLLLLAASAALVLVTAEVIRTMADALQLVRALLAGAFFCCLVGVAQFVFRVNPMEWIQAAMPGFTYNGGDTPFQIRGSLMRVAGSTFHSIELGVVAAMLIPLSIWRSLTDPRGRRWFHWAQTALLVFAVTTTVSRSGILGLVVALLVFVPFLPRLVRRGLLLSAPFVVAGVFLIVPGFVGTIASALGADTSDPSIATRVNNYPRVVQLLDSHPILGSGPGNYTPPDALRILDNQYLGSLVTLGIVGLLATLAYFLLPGIAGVLAARAAVHPALRGLAGAVAAGALVAAVCSMTFDSLSFPVFALLYPALVGLAGGVWRMVRREADLRDDENAATARGAMMARAPAPTAKEVG